MRTRYTLNEIVTYDNYAEIVLYNNNCIEVARTKIDLYNVEKVKNLKWTLLSTGYVYNYKTKKRLHRLLLDPSGSNDVDHINHDPLDNRVCNLRECTRSQNQMNRKVKGIYYYDNLKMWVAQIRKDGRLLHLGCYANKDDAKAARVQAEKIFFGKYRCTV